MTALEKRLADAAAMGPEYAESAKRYLATRGGKRKGAGRKPRPSPLVGLSMRIEPELLKRWNAEKKRRRVSGPELLTALLQSQ